MIDPAPAFTKAALSEWLAQWLHPGADVYRALEAGHAHMVIEDHGRRRCEAESARWVSVMLSNLRRSMDDTYRVSKFAK